MRRIIFWIPILIIIAVVAVYFRQEILIFQPEHLPAAYQFNFPGHYQELMWDVNGAKINALHFRVKRPKGVVLYFPGNAGNLSAWGDVATEFTGRGYDVLIPEYRGYGKSTGKINNEDMLLHDAAFAYRYLQKHYDENRIVIYGRSLGSGFAVYLGKRARPRMIILESPFFTISDVAHVYYPFIPIAVIERILRYHMPLNQWIQDVRCPVYLIHGTKDDIVPYDSSIRLLPLIRAKATMISITGGNHNNLSDFSYYHKQIDLILQ